MLAVFRTDASGQIGTGHAVRCLTLADALKQNGFDCQFICRTLPGDLAESLRARGHALYMLPSAQTGGEWAQASDRAHHAHWLGADWKTDAAQTLTAIEGKTADWLIVDHYAIDERWESVLRSNCRRIMVIDDLADRQHDCDLLLDQNLIAGWQHRYDDKVAADCELLLGPAYALLQPVYADLRPRVPPREGPVRRILVYFGGADTNNLTGKAVSALASLGRAGIDVDVVINPAHDHAPAIRAAVGNHPSMVLHEGLPSLARLMVSADLAIGASGTNSWERCCLGLPTLVVTLAENQKPIAAELDRLGLIRLLGHKDEINVAGLAREISAVLDGRRPFGRIGGQIDIDGKGAQRVAAALSACEPFKARPAVVEDASLLRRWRRADTAGAEADLRRFREGLRDLNHCSIFSVETANGFPLAQVRFDDVDRMAVIDGVFAPLARRFALESTILATAIAAHRKAMKDVLTFLPAGHGLQNRKELPPSSAHSLKIAICSDAGSWINETVAELATGWLGDGHCVSWVHDADDLPGGDLCFYLSYGRIVGESIRSRYDHNLIVHASDLPKGRGWSPASWLILGGAEQIPVTLFEAIDKVDAGPIYLQEWIDLEGTELIEDWRAQVARKTRDLANAFVASYPGILDKAREQIGEPTMYPRRRAQDSLLDSDLSIAAQFNQLRIVDNDSYPAFFRHNGKEFVLKILPR